MPAKQANGSNIISLTVMSEHRNFLMGLVLHKKKKVVAEAIERASSLDVGEKRRDGQKIEKFSTTVDNATFELFQKLPKSHKSVLFGQALQEIIERI